MINITYNFVKHCCPLWKTDVRLRLKYGIFDENKPYNATFISCQCPIIENIRLPRAKRDPNLSLYLYCTMEKECLSSVCAPQKITLE